YLLEWRMTTGAGLIPFKRVELPGGPVSLVPIEQLQAWITQLGASAAQAHAQAENFGDEAQAKMAEAGAVMADRWQEWPAKELFEPIRQAIALQQQLGGLNAALTALGQHPHQGLSG